MVLLASKYAPIYFINPTHKFKCKTVRQVIGKLPPLKQGESHPSDRMHKCSRLSDINLERIRASKPGGHWKDWDDILVADCHKKHTGTQYVSVYGRMEWDQLSPTITTQSFGFGNGRFGHPEQDRALSLRESALLQTFPKAFKFVPNNQEIHMKTIGRVIGNAVPVRLAKVIARSIKRHLEEVNG